MKTIKKGLHGKICVLSGSSEGTRLVPFFRTNPGTIKMMTNEAYSLRELFDRDISYDFKQYNIQLIVNGESRISKDDLEYMKSTMGDNFHYKYVDNVWTNLFLKDSSNIINLDLYGLGYNPHFYHASNKEDHQIGNRGMSFKLTSDELTQALIEWFDAIWEKEQMIEFEPMKFISRRSGQMKHYDGGGRYFSTTTVEVSNRFDQEGIIETVDIAQFIHGDLFSEDISSKARYLIYEDKIALSYDDKSNMNLCISFYDEDVLDYIYTTIRHMGYDVKPHVDSMEFLLKRKVIYSHQLYAFIMFYLDNRLNLELMKRHYLSIRPIDGERKFRDTIKAIEKEEQIDLSFLK